MGFREVLSIVFLFDSVDCFICISYKLASIGARRVAESVITLQFFFGSATRRTNAGFS